MLPAKLTIFLRKAPGGRKQVFERSRNVCKSQGIYIQEEKILRKRN